MLNGNILPLDGELRTRWFTEARFGAFIHFGLYSIPAGIWRGVPMGRNWYAEWMRMQGNWPRGISKEEYGELAARFNPTQFDAEQWVGEIANAGMRYLVITSKHHDGFALWPSEASNFNVMAATPFKRDILGELAVACKRNGVKFCLYYSHWLDWEHRFGGCPHEEEFHSEPRWPQPSNEQFEIYWQEKCLPQIRELIDRYHPSLFWFDTWAANSSDRINQPRLEELVGMIRKLEPACLINSRIGVWGHPLGNKLVDVISMGDNEYSKEMIAQPWETSATMQRSWGYHQLDYQWEPTSALLLRLIGNVAKNGNYQLNIGPMGDGRFSAPAVRRLCEIGAWMSVNEESIRGAGPCALGQSSGGILTSRMVSEDAERIYLHISKPRGGESVVIPGFNKHPKAANVLETGQPVVTALTEKGLSVKIPEELHEDLIAVISIDRQLNDTGAV